jgi:beta-galactosidase
MNIVFSNTTVSNISLPATFRCEFFIKGWQFGKYGKSFAFHFPMGTLFSANAKRIVNNIGPQLRYPVPEGILNYYCTNYLALTLWSLENDPVKMTGLALQTDAVLQSS